jgi:hypothetical protein
MPQLLRSQIASTAAGREVSGTHRPDATIQKLVVAAQRLLQRLQTAAPALRDTAPDGLIARSLAGLTAALPDVIATMKTAIDHAGTPVEVDGYLDAMHAAQELIAHTHRMAHNLDPHYGVFQHTNPITRTSFRPERFRKQAMPHGPAGRWPDRGSTAYT